MIKYLVNGTEVNEKEFNSKLEESVDEYCADIFDDYLDDAGTMTEVCGLHFSPSQIISNCDPTAYRCLLADFSSGELERAKDELDCSNCVLVGNDEFSIEYIDDEDEDEDEDESGDAGENDSDDENKEGEGE